MGFLPFLDIGAKLIDKLIPDPAAKQAAQLELLKLQQAGEFKSLEADLSVQLGQIEVNKIEAASTNPFVSGWCPAVGWCGVLGLLYTFLGQPLITWAASMYGKPAAPITDTTDLFLLLGGLLGMGGMRTWEKSKGVARN